MQPQFSLSSHVLWQRPVFALAKYVYKVIDNIKQLIVISRGKCWNQFAKVDSKLVYDQRVKKEIFFSDSHEVSLWVGSGPKEPCCVIESLCSFIPRPL